MPSFLENTLPLCSSLVIHSFPFEATGIAMLKKILVTPPERSRRGQWHQWKTELGVPWSLEIYVKCYDVEKTSWKYGVGQNCRYLIAFADTLNAFWSLSQEEEDKEAVGTVEKSKNWSSVNLAFQEPRAWSKNSREKTHLVIWSIFMTEVCPSHRLIKIAGRFWNFSNL